MLKGWGQAVCKLFINCVKLLDLQTAPKHKFFLLGYKLVLLSAGMCLVLLWVVRYLDVVLVSVVMEFMHSIHKAYNNWQQFYINIFTTNRRVA